MLDPVLFSMARIAYIVAGALCLLTVGVVLVRLVLTCSRRGVPSRTLLRQELIWTLVPALVLVGLTVMSDIPRGWARAVAGDGAREAWSVSK